MNYTEALNKLFSLHQFGIKLGLENILNFLEHIGNPHKKLKAIHVAGSNGKGSTSSFIASILKEADYKVGLYTSPHFVKFNERIRINGTMIDDSYIVDFMNDNIDFIDANSVTFFELTTALAFQYFYEQNVDVAVIETGLGGRLDATNVLDSSASVITSISYEHTNILGNSLKCIAGEKAGIIKERQNVFVGILPREAADEIEKKCKEKKSVIFKLEDYFHKQNFEFRYGDYSFVIDDIPLKGNYQKQNAALAVLVVQNLYPKLANGTILNGLQKVIENSGIQGRYERYSKIPNIIFDSAHNVEGLTVFLDEYKNERYKYKKNIVLYGAMKDKNIEKILKLLGNNFDEVFATDINYDRAITRNEIVEIGKLLDIKISHVENHSDFIVKFKNSKVNESLVVLGSMYVLGEIKKELLLE